MASTQKILVLALLFVLLAFQLVEGRLHTGTHSVGDSGYGRSVLQSIDCDAACSSRCLRLRLNFATCKPACLRCCNGCNCVPPENPSPGVDPCHCYPNMPTRWLPKCP